MERKLFNSGYALVIGVGADLPITVHDAVALRDLLIDPLYSAYPPDHVELLVGAEATRSGVLSAFKKLNKRVANDPEAAIIIYFSGHGVETPDHQYFLLPFNYRPYDLSISCISGTEFTECLKTLKSRRLLIFLDTCYAGGLAEIRELQDITNSPVPSDLLVAVSEGSGKALIASSKKDQESFILQGDQNSVFTLTLLEALSGQCVTDLDGYVRVDDLAMYISREVAMRTNNQQHPLLRTQDADNFAIAYYAGGEKSPHPVAVQEFTTLSLSEIRKDLVGVLENIPEMVDKKVRTSFLQQSIPIIKLDGLQQKRHYLMRIDLRNIVDHLIYVDELEKFIEIIIDFVQNPTVNEKLKRILNNYILYKSTDATGMC